MSEGYRVNLRLNSRKEKHREIIEFFKESGRDKSFSRNDFIIDAITEKLNDSNLLDEIRNIVREEMSNISIVAPTEKEKSSEEKLPSMTEEQRMKNEEDVLDVLDMFG